MGTGAGRVVLLALVLLFALQTTPASAGKKACVIFFSAFPASVDVLLATITNEFRIMPYNLRAISGVAVQIDESFLPRLQQLPGVMAVIPDKQYNLQTTHSWDFLGLASDGEITPAWSSARLGADTIIGSIDSGVWPESLSFQNDSAVPDVSPLVWRGKCDNGTDPTFKCNSKLIGARFFNQGIQLEPALGGGGQQPSQADLWSPRDYVGHGSHTLSTAGGSFVPGASVFGHGKGTAAGGAPRARVAAYKACYNSQPECSGIDILTAMAAAVADGVHVLSLSLGAPASDYLTDPIAIGAFFAVQKGVTVVCAAGNSGPQPSSDSNVAPWIFTVGASTMDRDFPAYVSFNGTTIQGESLAESTQPIGQPYPMISGGDATAVNQSTTGGKSSLLCLPGSLDPDKVKGKIVVCVRGVNARMEKGYVVKKAGGVGMVLCNDATTGNTVVADPHMLPAAHCSFSQCVQLFNYLQSTNNPLGYINATGASFGNPATKIAAFSSRGPNAITPQILKPDIIAPGVSVIAAYSGAVSPTELPFDDRRVPYNIMSGTSMACPHVSGIVALLKTMHPTWSPAMIKSGIMTTASTMDKDGKPIQDDTGADATPFDYGSGHVDPVKALDPGLVYDTTLLDYTNFICSLKLTQNPLPSLLPPLLGNLTQPAIDLLVLPLFNAAGEPCKCSRGPFGRPEDLNYPSIAVPCLSGSATVRRRLKNVGGAPSRYKVTVTEPAGVKVTVVPSELDFGVGEEKEFTVKLDVDANAPAANGYVFGSIVWSDDAYAYASGVNKAHRVRSPVVVKTKCG